MSKADVLALIRQHHDERKKEANEHMALKASIVKDLQGLVNSQVAAAMASLSGPKRGLQKAGANAGGAGVASVDADATSNALGAEAKQCAANLLLKLGKAGTRAQSKSG